MKFFVFMIKSRSKILLAAFFLIPLTPSAVDAITLEEAVCMMLEFEPELNGVEYDTLSLREEQRIARSELLPKVSLSGSAGWSKRSRTLDGLVNTGDSLFQRQIGISVRQLVFDGGTGRRQARASRNAYLAQQYLEKGMIEDRVVDLVEVYLEVIRSRKQVALAEKNAANHRQMRDMLAERVAAGGSRTDLALIQGRLGLAMNTLSTQRLQYKLATGRFERLTGKTPSKLVYPKIPTVPETMDAVDVSRNHRYLAAMEALEAAKHRALANKGLYAPKVYLDAGYSRGQDVIGINGRDDEARALLVGSWDIFRSGYHKAMNARSEFQVGKYEELARSGDIQRYYDLNVAWQERAGSIASVEAMKKYSNELASVADDYEEQFKVGRQELLNILDVQSEFYTASSQLLNAKFDMDIGAFRILKVQGKAAEFIMGPDGCDRCLSSGKELVQPNWVIEKGPTDPDARVPVTQPDLMTGRFDSDGPKAKMKSPHQSYYMERAQLPVATSSDSKPKGGVFRLLSRKRKQSK